jgi:peroxiredoxin
VPVLRRAAPTAFNLAARTPAAGGGDLISASSPLRGEGPARVPVLTSAAGYGKLTDMYRTLRFVLLLTMVAGWAWAAGELSNRRAPGFSLPDSNLKQHDLQDYRGKVVVVNFMRTACPHCAVFSKVLAQVEQKYGDTVQVISIVNPPDSQKTVQQYQSANQLSSLMLFDCGQVTASYLKITPQNPSIHVPHFFVIDTEGMIRDDRGYSEAAGDIFEGQGIFKIIDQYVPSATLADSR